MSHIPNYPTVITSLSDDDALRYWQSGSGTTVYVDMTSHMTTGGGRVFSTDTFSDDFYKAAANQPVGTVLVFETNSVLRNATGALEASESYSYYSDYMGLGVFSDDAYVWGRTSAGFRGTVTVLPNGQLRTYP